MLKQKRFLPILLVSACMLVLVAFAAWTQSGDLIGQVRFYDSSRNQELDLFYDQDQDSYVLFLPAYLSPEAVGHACPQGIRVSYDGSETLEQASFSQTVKLTISQGLRRKVYGLRLEQNAPIPSLFIEAEEGILEYLHADKKNTRDVVVNLVDSQGETMLHSKATMYGRGNGSWESPSKRPYNLEFPQEISVGPFSQVTKLGLLADFSDESKLRNSLAYYAGQELGIDYASAYQHTDVYVNGEYIGIYGMVTKQEYKKHIQDDAIQAVFEIASSENRVEFFSSLGYRINVMYGSLVQVEQLVNRLEDALQRQDWEACAEIIDVESFARKYAMEEFLANLDLAYASQYFYLDDSGKIKCMLPWDYDWTLGSSHAYYNNRQANELKVLRSGGACWYGRLLEDEGFRLATVEVLEREFDDSFLEKLDTHLEADIRTIRNSWENDKLRWKYELPYNQFDIASGVEDLEGFLDVFTDYFRQRRALLTGYYRNPDDYRCVHFFGARWGNLIIPCGDNLQDYLQDATILDVNIPGERFLGWATEKGKPVHEIGMVDKDYVLIGEYEELESSESWLETAWKEIVIVGAFAVTALGLFLIECKHIRKKRNL